MVINLIYTSIITIFIGFIIENFKLVFYLKRIDYINVKVRDIASNILLGKNIFDIFTVNDLRKAFDEEFLRTKMVDEFELYKISDSKIKLRYFKGSIVAELEILALGGEVELIKQYKKVLE